MTDTITIYHNPRCSKSRQTLALLEENGIEPKVVLYLQTPPSATQLGKLGKALGMKARQFMRSKESEYKELNLANKDLSEKALLAAMAENPKLIERPIVVKGDKAVLGRPPENVLSLIGKH